MSFISTLDEIIGLLINYILNNLYKLGNLLLWDCEGNYVMYLLFLRSGILFKKIRDPIYYHSVENLNSIFFFELGILLNILNF